MILSPERELRTETEVCQSLAERCAFVLGHARSGTTILAQMINSSPRALLTAEANFHLTDLHGNFRENYNRQHKNFENQVSKSSYAPHFGISENADWWQWLWDAAKHYHLVGDKLAFSPYHFSEIDEDLFKSFYEVRFFQSKFILTIREPVQTILSCNKSIGYYSILEYIKSWAQFICLWTDMIRIFPQTYTVIFDELGADTVDEMAGFLNIDLGSSTALLSEGERRTHFPTTRDATEACEQFGGRLEEIWGYVRRARALPHPMLQADQKRRRAANDTANQISFEGKGDAVVPTPVGQAWIGASELLSELEPLIANLKSETKVVVAASSGRGQNATGVQAYSMPPSGAPARSALP